MNIVLVEPEIPPNTGNVARLCAGTGCKLHLIHPLGFSVDDRQLKRAGLDYWHLLDIHHYDHLEQLFQRHPNGRFWFFSTHGRRSYHEVQYQTNDFLVFGKETQGLPKELLAANREQTLRIPLRDEARSLNLSNAVAIVAYEGLRQNGFPGLR